MFSCDQSNADCDYPNQYCVDHSLYTREMQSDSTTPARDTKIGIAIKKILVLLNKNIYSKFIDQTNINMLLLYIDQQYINLHP